MSKHNSLKEFPISKYNVGVHGNRVTVKSTYAGREVTGSASCAPEDVFNIDDGIRLAAARCNYKVARLRAARAKEKVREEEETFQIVANDLKKAKLYREDSLLGLAKAKDNLIRVRNSLI